MLEWECAHLLEECFERPTYIIFKLLEVTAVLVGVNVEVRPTVWFVLSVLLLPKAKVLATLKTIL